MEDVALKWKQFLHGDDRRKARDELVLHYYFLVERVARKVSVNMPIPTEDLQADGTFGLIDAIDKYDPERGVRFEAYAVTRIRGAIIDGVRAMDWVPRSVRAKNNHVDAVTEQAAQRLGRFPTLAEVASRSGLAAGDIGRMVGESKDHITWDWHSEAHDNERSLGEVGPGDSPELEEFRDSLADSFRSFDERERMLFALYYYEGLTLSEIGVVLGVTEARVCQIHTRAMRVLCEQVSPR